jgi:hypothetical protein
MSQSKPVPPAVRGVGTQHTLLASGASWGNVELPGLVEEVVGEYFEKLFILRGAVSVALLDAVAVAACLAGG